MNVLVIEQDFGKISLVYPAEGVSNDQAAAGRAYVEIDSSLVPQTREFRDGWKLSEDRRSIVEGVFEYGTAGEVLGWSPRNS